MVKQYHESQKPQPAIKAKGSTFNAGEQQSALATFLGVNADVKVSGNGKGKITIPFKSEADFNRIINLIKGSE
ncbi:MAG: hypothetical protein EOO48_08950 [Flavobacterium sp.]|nr:MAG: hypothetical protein EOO48_08950 [Flavobacterium sp.]